jgi:hypothetical protein
MARSSFLDSSPLAMAAPKAEAALADAAAHDLFQPIEGAGADEQDIRGVDLDELLLRPIARPIGGDGGLLSFENLEQRLLHALAGDVAGDGGPAALARDLVDLVDAHDAARGFLGIVAGVAVERLDDAVDVLANVAGLGQGGGVGHGEGHVELARQGLHEQGLSAAGGTDEQDVALLDFHVGRLAPLADALVVVVDGNRQRLLGPLLADDVLVDLVEYLTRPWIAWTLRRLFLGDDVVAQGNALVADENARARDELSHLAPAFLAEGAVEVVHTSIQYCTWKQVKPRGRRRFCQRSRFFLAP